MTIATTANNRTCALPAIASQAKASARQGLRKPTRATSATSALLKKPTTAFRCQQPSAVPTLGHLVEAAYNKNKQLVKSGSAPVAKLLLQQQLWTKLQGSFFAPGADATAMSKRSALTFEERHSGCGCPYSSTSQLPTIASTTTTTTTTSKGSCRAQTSSVLLQASSPKSSHPLASSVTARTTALLSTSRRSTAL